MFPAVMDWISTCWSANGTSSLLILSLYTKHEGTKGFLRYFLTRMIDESGVDLCCAGTSVRAVPVDVVEGGLRFESPGVNPEEHHRAALLVV